MLRALRVPTSSVARFWHDNPLTQGRNPVRSWQVEIMDILEEFGRTTRLSLQPSDGACRFSKGSSFRMERTHPASPRTRESTRGDWEGDHGPRK